MGESSGSWTQAGVVVAWCIVVVVVWWTGAGAGGAVWAPRGNADAARTRAERESDRVCVFISGLFYLEWGWSSGRGSEQKIGTGDGEE